MNQLLAKLDAITHEHRHRVTVKITDGVSKDVAEREVVRHLRSALQTVQSLSPDDALENRDALRGLLSDLMKQLEARSA